MPDMTDITRMVRTRSDCADVSAQLDWQMKSSHTEPAKECVTEEMVESEAATTAETKSPVRPGDFDNTCKVGQSVEVNSLSDVKYLRREVKNCLF